MVDACAAVAENTDAVPFAHQTSGSWSTTQLWETILLAQAGIEGNAAFIHQGDWAAGAYSGTDGFEYGTDWGQVTYPGTEGSYLLNMDSFPFLANNPSPEATRQFLSYLPAGGDPPVRCRLRTGASQPLA